MRRKALLACVLALMVTVMAAQARAADIELEGSMGCAEFLVVCYQAAFALDSFWETLAAASLCDRVYLECVRVKLIGF